MTVQEYLSQLSIINENIKNCTDEREERKSLLGTISSPNFSKSSFGSGGQNSAQFVSDYERIEALESKINDYERSKNTILDQIRSLDNAVHIHILFEYYEKGKTLYEIAQEIGYEYGYVRKLHIAALNKFQKKYPFLKKGTKRNSKEQ